MIKYGTRSVRGHRRRKSVVKSYRAKRRISRAPKLTRRKRYY